MQCSELRNAMFSHPWISFRPLVDFSMSFRAMELHNAISVLEKCNGKPIIPRIFPSGTVYFAQLSPLDSMCVFVQYTEFQEVFLKKRCKMVVFSVN